MRVQSTNRSCEHRTSPFGPGLCLRHLIKWRSAQTWDHKHFLPLIHLDFLSVCTGHGNFEISKHPDPERLRENRVQVDAEAQALLKTFLKKGNR